MCGGVWVCVCSLDNFLLKNVIVFFFEIKFQNGASYAYVLYFWLCLNIWRKNFVGVWLLWLLTIFVIYICELNYFSCMKRRSRWKEEYPKKRKQQWRSFVKRAIFLTYFSHYLVTREKTRKFLQYISLSHIHTLILLTRLTFFVLPILQKLRIYHV